MKRIDAADILAVTGVASIGWGVYQIHRPAAFIVVGAILFGLAVFSWKARN